VLVEKALDGLLLPVLQPEVPGNPTVVLVDLAIAGLPVIELLAAIPSQRINRIARISPRCDQ